MKRTLVLLAIGASLSACASGGFYGPPPPADYGPPPPPRGPGPQAFDASGFAWSQRPGGAAIQGQVNYRGQAAPYTCAGSSVALTPDTPYSRRRIVSLYGSADRATVPVGLVRSRQSAQPSDAYSRFVRVQKCDPAGRFSFEGLPAGGWFVIVAGHPAAGPGEAIAFLRRVQTSNGQVHQIALP